MKLAAKMVRFMMGLMDNNQLSQEKTLSQGEQYYDPAMPQLCRQTAAEGIVLLKNEGVLPLKKNARVAIFGRCQIDYFCVGYGSGGDVKAAYRKDFLAALEEAPVVPDPVLLDAYKTWTALPKNEKDDGYWGHWPMNYPEMSLKQEEVLRAAGENEVAVVVIGRAAGEDRENKLSKGSYYLTALERDMLKKVTGAFSKTVVVLDCGNVIDLSFVEEYPISALVYAWQGGMEAGPALWDVLCGNVCPSGRLTDTIARNYANYPSARFFGKKEFNPYSEDIYVGYRYFETFAKGQVLYPFGYGLSYTKFDITDFRFDRDRENSLSVTVKNTGAYPGKQVVQVYVQPPQGKLGAAARNLVAFAKTGTLAPEESQELILSFSDRDCGYYSEEHSAWMLEPGQYDVFCGDHVRSAKKAAHFQVERETVLEQCRPICRVKEGFRRYTRKNGLLVTEPVPVSDYSLKDRILAQLPKDIPFTGDLGYRFEDVQAGKITLETFVGQLTEEELEALTRGYGVMNSPDGTPGNAGSFGATIPSLKAKGIPAVITCDGPSGLRLNRLASLLPCGTAIASTWNTELAEQLYDGIHREMMHYDIDVVLGPGMNIHRNPLCGRNFEYYSEDPLLTGKMAAAAVRGIQRDGKTACPKHFAANNQEVNRNRNDSRISERALREIYLRGFEICVKEADPHCIMTSYNKINGVWSHYNYDLAQTVLRGEWGFDGVVITDWWMQKSVSPEFPELETNGYRVRAGVDVLMPGNMRRFAREYESDGTTVPGLTHGELTAVACRVLSFILKQKT